MWGELLLSLYNFDGYIITILSLAFMACIIIIERLIMLQFVYNINFQKFLFNLRKMISSEDFERAINFCKSISRTSLPRIALHALEASENDPTTVRGVIETETIEMLPRIESRLAVLPALATLIMLVGILGTIDGLWWAFHSIDVLDTAKKQASLANGIAGSLNPTAISLTICTIILALYHMIKGLAIRIIERVHHGVTVIMHLLAPPEMATAMVSAPMARTVDEPVQARTEERAPPPAERTANEDAFDDASVEDIKDEEEII